MREEKTMDNKQEIVKKILECIAKDEWDEIIKLIKNGDYVDINDIISNGNNIFHLACIKGKDKIINELIDLKNNGKIKLNVNKHNKDGIPGIHLYYKYGGTNADFFDNDEICNLDRNSKNLAIYVINDIYVLEKLIDKLIEKQCLENLEIPTGSDTHYLFEELIKKIVELNNPIMTDKYVKIIKKLYVELKIKDIVFIAILINCPDVIKMLMTLNYDFMIYNNELKMTSLAYAVYMNRTEIVLNILEYVKLTCNDVMLYKIINASEKQYENRPIFIAIDNKNYIILKILVSYMEQYVNKNNILFSEEIDNYYDTYLHRLLLFNDEDNVPVDLLTFFINHTDLNQECYSGDSPAHLLFSNDLWKTLKNVLSGRSIDLVKTDSKGKNCYSYIADKDMDEFIKLTKTITLPLNVKNNKDIAKIFNIKNVKNILNISKNNSLAKNTGIFGSSLYHYIIYLHYLRTKYPDVLFVATRPYNKEAQTTDMFLAKMTNYPLSEKQTTMNKMIGLYLYAFYSYLPHHMYWINEYQYYINPLLADILKKHNKKYSPTQTRYRFVMFRITIIDTSTTHANTLIYDRVNKEAWRFEPYGISDVVDNKLLDTILFDYLKTVYGEITYYEPDSYMKGLNFQLVSGEDIYKNLGDPGGYCLAWCLWFIEAVLSQPEIKIKDLIKNFINKHYTNIILSEEEGISIKSTSHYLDFIRRYANNLDMEKNKILELIGINKYNFYDTIPSIENYEKIIDYFKKY